MNDVSVEVSRAVYIDSEGVFIRVGPDGDGLDLVTVSTVDQASKDWFGNCDITMPRDFAKLLGEALINASEGK